MTDAVSEGPCIKLQEVAVPDHHWNKTQQVAIEMNRALLADATFLSASMDEGTALGQMSFLSCHLQFLDSEIKRVSIFIELKEASRE